MEFVIDNKYKFEVKEIKYPKKVTKMCTLKKGDWAVSTLTRTYTSFPTPTNYSLMYDCLMGVINARRKFIREDFRCKNHRLSNYDLNEVKHLYSVDRDLNKYYTLFDKLVENRGVIH